MIRRVTTNGTMYSYKANLMRSFNKLVNASDRLITNRRFNSYAEDPAAASRAFQLRRNMWNTESQLRTNSSVQGKFSQGWDAIDEVYDKLGNELANFSDLRAENDPDGSARKALGQSMIATANSIVYTMNSKFGDEYIFAGADGLNPPFSWAEDGSTLLFRGVPVDSDPDDPAFQAQPAVFEAKNVPVPGAGVGSLTIGNFTATVTPDAAPKTQLQEFANAYNNDAANADWTASVNEDGTGIVFTAKQAGDMGTLGLTQPAGTTQVSAGQDVQQDKIDAAQKAQEAMKAMMEEYTHVDLGMGMHEQNGKMVESTVFNSALCGLKYLGGFGLDADGDPENFISIIKKVGDLLYNCDEDDGSFTTGTRNDLDRLTGKLQETLAEVSLNHVDLDTEVAFLKSNNTRLTATKDTLNDQITQVEDMDPAEAITSLMWAQYSYNAALKIGNGILSQSLLDYLG